MLNYAIIRFLNIVINLFDFISKTYTLVVIINDFFKHIQQFIFVFIVVKDVVKHHIQTSVNFNNSRTYIQIYKYYIYYKKN